MNLNELITHAYETTPYYNKLFLEHGVNPKDIREINDLAKLPVLTKDNIRQNTFDLISNLFELNELKKERTSGSTGEPLEIYKTYEGMINANFSMAKFRNRMFGINAKTRTCYFYMFSRNSAGQLTIEPVIRDNNSISLNIFTIDDKQLHDYVNYINDFNPEYILSIPSSLLLFANFIENNNLTITDSIKCIELKGEYVLESQINKIKSVFNADVINHYGSTETYGIAFSCKNGNMHVLHDNVIVEIVDQKFSPVNKGEKGVICVTSLNNNAMPLIRYLLGDEAIECDCNCDCGHKGKKIKILSGRVTEYVSMPNDKLINSGILYLIVENINFIYKNMILQFQIIQEELKKFNVTFVLTDQTFREVVEKWFNAEMNKYGFDECIIKFFYKDFIQPNKKTGKNKYFINNIESSDYYGE